MNKCRKPCGGKVFVTKLIVTSIVVYIAYNLLYFSDQDVEVGKSPLKNLQINSILRRKTEKTGHVECPVPRYNSSLPLSIGCQRLTPVIKSCQVADKIFFSSPVETCKHQLKNNICQVKVSGVNVNVVCSDKICAEKKVSLGAINKKSGELEWQEFESTKHLELHIRKVLKKENDHFGFYFIRCAINVDEISEQTAGNVINSYNGMDDYIMVEVVAQQLLVLPPFIKKHKKSQNHININIIFIDSVSHSHFLRSMPKTLQTLRGITETSILNFELFQSLKGRTYENLQALFSGKLYDVEKPFGTHDMPPDPVNLERILTSFKDQGYETMYTEDLCWLWEWGLVKNLLAYMPGYDVNKRWKILLTALEKAGIDRIDMTLASCEILSDNQHHDPFHGPPAICYNGQYQHHYILDYLTKRQESLEINGQPFFHNTLLNVAHDDYGRRIQTLDEDFAVYMKTVSKLDNTLTIILSDHGNTYGEYMKRSEEARVEMFHPVLFMVIPPGVARSLGQKRMNAMKVNQQRLISILDIHYALRLLSDGKIGELDENHRKYSIKPDGIFSEIPVNRSCGDIPRIEPNVCICQDFEKGAENDTRYAILAEFALGSINNVIQEQYRKSHPDAKIGFGSCQRLVAHHFGNIKQRHNQAGEHEVKLDLYIPNPDNSSLFEIIMVILKVHSKGIKLVTYERMTPYSPFEACSDIGVAIKMCVCSLTKAQHHVNEVPDVSNYPEIFGTKTVKKHLHNQCLYIFMRKNKAGVIFEASNKCSDKKYRITLNFTTTNLTSSLVSPVTADLWPGMTSFLVVMLRTDTKFDWDFKYSVNYDSIDV